MTEIEQKLWNEIEEMKAKLIALESEVAFLRSNSNSSQEVRFETLPSSAVVGADYVAYRFGISQESVKRQRFKTNQIPRVRSNPLGWKKADVDETFRRLHKPQSVIAQEIRHRTNKKRKRI